jgi:hypothetical protein
MYNQRGAWRKSPCPSFYTAQQGKTFNISHKAVNQRRDEMLQFLPNRAAAGRAGMPRA